MSSRVSASLQAKMPTMSLILWRILALSQIDERNIQQQWHKKHNNTKKCCKHHLQWPSTNLRRFSTQNRAGSFVVSLFIPIGIVYRSYTLANSFSFKPLVSFLPNGTIFPTTSSGGSPPPTQTPVQRPTHLKQSQAKPFKMGGKFAAQVIGKVSPATQIRLSQLWLEAPVVVLVRLLYLVPLGVRVTCQHLRCPHQYWI